MEAKTHLDPKADKLGVEGCCCKSCEALAQVIQDAVEDEIFPDEPEMWPCNDCGVPCLKGDELCGPCYEDQRRRDELECDSLRTLGLCEADFI